MNIDLFEKLLKSDESETLDFKSEFYKFSENTTDKNRKNENAAFIKDIAAFANTIRDHESYIILGVGVNPDGSTELIGLENYYDNAKLQQKVNDNLSPVPKFSANFFTYKNKKFCAIKFPIPIYTRPSIVNKDFGPLLKNTLYIRVNSSTKDANSDEREAVYTWLKELSIQRNKLRKTEDSLIKLIDESIDDNDELIKEFEAEIYHTGEGLGMSINEIEALIRRRVLNKERRSFNIRNYGCGFFIALIILTFGCFMVNSFMQQKREQESKRVRDSINEEKLIDLISQNKYTEAKKLAKIVDNSNIDLKKIIDSEINFHILNGNFDTAVLTLNNFISNPDYNPINRPTRNNYNHKADWVNGQVKKIALALVSNHNYQKATEVTLIYHLPILQYNKKLQKKEEDFTEREALLNKIKEIEKTRY